MNWKVPCAPLSNLQKASWSNHSLKVKPPASSCIGLQLRHTQRRVLWHIVPIDIDRRNGRCIAISISLPSIHCGHSLTAAWNAGVVPYIKQWKRRDNKSSVFSFPLKANKGRYSQSKIIYNARSAFRNLVISTKGLRIAHHCRTSNNISSQMKARGQPLMLLWDYL